MIYHDLGSVKKHCEKAVRLTAWVVILSSKYK